MLVHVIKEWLRHARFVGLAMLAALYGIASRYNVTFGTARIKGGGYTPQRTPRSPILLGTQKNFYIFLLWHVIHDPFAAPVSKGSGSGPETDFFARFTRKSGISAQGV